MTRLLMRIRPFSHHPIRRNGRYPGRLEQAREKGATLWSIVNAFGSQAMRVSDGSIAMQAGPEIGVASTKAFTTSLPTNICWPFALGDLRGVLAPERRRQLVTTWPTCPIWPARC
jgi:glutamine---fructose-6-phosphate transaminase (isomerizing)